ncbi:MAG: TetR/AcrR family transcriptional regulator [Polyangiaceae bacterium]
MAAKKKALTRKPKQTRSRETVRAIVEATEKIIVADGIAGLSTTKVAEVAGVSVGTLYEYFQSKEELVRAVEERSWSSQLQVLASKLPELDLLPVGEGIYQLTVLAMNMIGDRADLHGITADDPATLDQRREVIGQIAAFFETRLGHAKYELRPSPEHLRLALTIMVKAVGAMTWLGVRDHEDEFDAGVYQHEIATMVVNYLLVRGRNASAKPGDEPVPLPTT